MSNDLYDPQAPEGASPVGSAYISKKDIKAIAIAAVVLTIVLYPIYQYQVRQSEKSRCTANMKAITEALNMYAEYKDERFPPIYRTGKGDVPGLGPTNLPYTWCDDISTLMSKRYSFVCPSAAPSEIVTSEDATNSAGTLKTSYGMYLPYSGYQKSLVANPDQSAIVAETSNNGAVESYDPLKMKDDSGNPLPDGFVIAWDNSNTEPDEKTKYVSRLAYPGSDGGKFTKDGRSRHDTGIHILTASGEVRTLPPVAAEFHQRLGSFTGLWAPPTVKVH